jgi:hypothetical protein
MINYGRIHLLIWHKNGHFAANGFFRRGLTQRPRISCIDLGKVELLYQAIASRLHTVNLLKIV